MYGNWDPRRFVGRWIGRHQIRRSIGRLPRQHEGDSEGGERIGGDERGGVDPLGESLEKGGGVREVGQV